MISTILVAGSVWLHSLATVIFVGHYILLRLVYLPALQDAQPTGCGTSLSAISKRSRNWLYAALGVFAATGFHLMLVNPGYLGLGNFGNAWSVLMLLKHVLILGMMGLGFWYNVVQRVGPVARSSTGAAEAIARFRRHVDVMAATGTAVLLPTAAAQAQ